MTLLRELCWSGILAWAMSTRQLRGWIGRARAQGQGDLVVLHSHMIVQVHIVASCVSTDSLVAGCAAFHM